MTASTELGKAARRRMGIGVRVERDRVLYKILTHTKSSRGAVGPLLS